MSKNRAVSPHSNSSSDEFFVARAEPMIEVYSIRIFKNSFLYDREEKCRVYGTITVVDLKINRPCFLYNRCNGDECLDVISFHRGNLTLNGRDSIFAMDEPVMFFNIRDKATDAAVVVGRVVLENATTVEFEQDRVLTVEVEGVGRASVQYKALRFGVAACLDLQIMKCSESDSENESDSDEEGVDMYGSILAYHSSDYCRRKRKLFEKQASESEIVKFECSINLLRQLVAVPAYSSLVIEFDLRDPVKNEPIIDGQAIVESHNYESRKNVMGKSCRNCKMFVRVNWMDAFMLDEPTYDRSTESGIRIREVLPNGMLLCAHPLLEIFSVFIGRQNCESEEFNLYGKIELADINYNLFTATKEDPYTLQSGCYTIPLKCPSRTLSPPDFFSIFIDLRDVKGRIHIKGYAQSSHGLNNHHKSWFDKWLCSVVKGADENGFAAVNYMVMTYAITAVVKVHFLSQGTTVNRDGLYGKIVAFYSKYRYTDDEREYYRSVLFERSEEKCFMPNGDNTEVKLSRSVVPVPLDSFLLIQVQLNSGVVRDSVDKTVQFLPGQVVSSSDIQGGGFAIRVSVEWSHG